MNLRWRLQTKMPVLWWGLRRPSHRNDMCCQSTHIPPHGNVPNYLSWGARNPTWLTKSSSPVATTCNTCCRIHKLHFTTHYILFSTILTINIISRKSINRLVCRTRTVFNVECEMELYILAKVIWMPVCLALLMRQQISMKTTRTFFLLN